MAPSLHPHCFHLHLVPYPVILQEERRTGLEADLDKMQRVVTEGSLVLLLSPTCTLCSFCSLCSCLLSCPSYCCLLSNPPYLPSSPSLLPNSFEFPHPGALYPGPSWFPGLVSASGSVGEHMCTWGFAAHGWHSINI